MRYATLVLAFCLLLSGCAGANGSVVHPPGSDAGTGAETAPETEAPDSHAGEHVDVPVTDRLPELTIWALDLGAAQEPEVLFRSSEPNLWLVGASPDGRYFLLRRSLALYKGDYQAIPTLLDRETGDLTIGDQVDIRYAVWSGDGFWIDNLVHLNLDLTATTYTDLASALGATSERPIRSVSMPVGTDIVAALVGKPTSPDMFDLVWADADGTSVTVVPELVKPHGTQGGYIAFVDVSPDGRYIAVRSEDPYAIIIDTANPGEEHWVRIPRPADITASDILIWAPDSERLLIGGLGVVDVTGDLLLPISDYTVLWSLDSNSLVSDVGFDRVLTVTTFDGHRREIPGPIRWLHGFLPDGRLIVSQVDTGR